MKLATHTKGPPLVCLDFRRGTAYRYRKRFDASGAGLGWQVECTQRAKFTPAEPIPAENVERYRLTGA